MNVQELVGMIQYWIQDGGYDGRAAGVPLEDPHGVPGVDKAGGEETSSQGPYFSKYYRTFEK